MDHSRLNSLKRSQLQQLARRESLRANLKNVEIVRLLLEKYPDGVPELTDKPSMSKHSPSSPSKAKQPTRRSKRKPTAKAKSVSVKTEETRLLVHVEPDPDEPEGLHKGRDTRSMAPPPVTPVAPPHSLRSSVSRRLPATPRPGVFVETETEGETGDIVVHPPEATPTPPEAAAATSHQAHEMLRNLANIIDTTSLNPGEPSSVLYRAKALNTVLDTTILPRMMKVDKEVKDFVWMRVAVESKLGPRLKEKGVLPDHRHSGVLNMRSDLSFPAPRPSPPKRPREKEDGVGIPPPAQPRTSKRTRVQ